MKIYFRLLCSILIISIFFSLFSCSDSDYFYEETRSLENYDSLSKEFFPKSINEEQVVFYGDARYNYWSQSTDIYLAIQYDTDEEFLQELSKINGYKEIYPYWEEQDFLIKDYNCIFFQCWFDKGGEENLSKYCLINKHETFYTATWDLIMYSVEEKLSYITHLTMIPEILKNGMQEMPT